MSDGMLMGMRHSHMLFIGLFILHYAVKTVLLAMGKMDALDSYRRKTRILLDMIVPLGFIGTGIGMMYAIGVHDLGLWFSVKLVVLVFALLIGILGFKTRSWVLTALAMLLFVYMIALAFSKSVTLGYGPF